MVAGGDRKFAEERTSSENDDGGGKMAAIGVNERRTSERSSADVDRKTAEQKKRAVERILLRERKGEQVREPATKTQTLDVEFRRDWERRDMEESRTEVGKDGTHTGMRMIVIGGLLERARVIGL